MCPSLGLRSKSTCFLWPQQKMWQLISMKYFSWSFQGTSVDNIIFSIKIERDNVQLSLRSAHVDLAISSFSFNFYLVSTTFWRTSCRVNSTGLQTNMSCFEISSIYLVNYVCVGKDLNKNSLPQKGPRNPILTLKIWKRDGADVVRGVIRRDRGDFDKGVDGVEESVEEEGGKKFSRSLNVVVAQKVLSQTLKEILKNPNNLFMRSSKYLLRVILAECLAWIFKMICCV